MTQAEGAPDESGGPVPPVCITRTVPAPPEVVWRAFTDPNALTAWFWPARLAPRVQTEPTVGGRFEIASAVARSMTSAVSGEYLEVSEPERLVFTWCWAGGDNPTRVTVSLDGDPDGTELTVEHDQFVDEEDRDAQSRGWRDCLDRLPGWLAAATAQQSR
ncbi:MAG: SRPBCC domain-containing protein [Actinocatenispora sp.]